MNKKKRGFSLAELLISLLVISLVLSAAIPAITKRSGQQRELIWRWTEENNAAFTATAPNQSVLVGMDMLQNLSADDTFRETSSKTSDGYGTKDCITSAYCSAAAGNIGTAADRDNIGNARAFFNGSVLFSDYGDKISILKRKLTPTASNFVNSHITFYSSDSDAKNTYYAGRLALDEANIALGIGSLQSLGKRGEKLDGVTALAGENTALGHYTLFRDTTGIRNTAVGKKALSYVEKGSYNTALGFGSLFWLQNYANTVTPDISGTDEHTNVDYESGFENTAAGAESMFRMEKGAYNTAFGSQAMKYTMKGVNNTAVGRLAMPSAYDKSVQHNSNTAVGAKAFYKLSGGAANANVQKNTALGAGACSQIQNGHSNICIGYNVSPGNVTTYTDGLVIGTSGSTKPLISGHTNSSKVSGNTYVKELIVNAAKVDFQRAESDNVMFRMIHLDTQKLNKAYFNLNDETAAKQASIQFSSNADGTVVYADARNGFDGGTFRQIHFNNGQLKIQPVTANSTSTDVKLYTNNSTNKLIINDKLTVQYSTAAGDSAVPTVDITSEAGFSVAAGSNKINIVGTSTSSLIQAGSNLIKGDTIVNAYGSGAAGDIAGVLNAVTSKLTANAAVLTSDAAFSSDRIADASITGYYTPSDERLKNITGSNNTGLKEINQLEVKNFTYKKDDKKTPHTGVIAQQLMKIFPHAVSKDKDGYYTIRTEDIFYALVNSVKELCVQVQELAAKITGLDARLKALEEENKLLKTQNAAFEKRLEALEKKQAAAAKN